MAGAQRSQAWHHHRVLPGLNRLFLKGEGKSMPAEYQVPDHEEHAVIEKIAALMTA